jgi:hypothetical protein
MKRICINWCGALKRYAGTNVKWIVCKKCLRESDPNEYASDSWLVRLGAKPLVDIHGKVYWLL